MAQVIVALLLGGGLFLWGLTQFRRSRATGAWPSAPGWIVQSTVTTSFTRGSDDSPDSYTYSPSVVYQYSINGQTFQGTRITYAGQGYGTPAKAQAALAPYPAGQPVNVFFNPARPHESVLAAGKTSGVMLMVLGALILAVGLVAAAK